MRRIFLLLLALAGPALRGWPQPTVELSLTEAYTRLEANYPALRNGALLEELYRTDLELLANERRPTLQLRAEGRLQSESVRLPGGGEMVPFDIDQPLYSLKSYAAADYLIYDGGRHAAQRSVKAAELATDRQAIAVAAYQLRPRINELFTGIELLRQRAALLDLTEASLQARRDQLEAGVTYGTVLASELQKLAVQELELRQRRADLIFRERSLVATLGELVGQVLPPDVALQFPELPDPGTVPALDRPEQEQFARQRAEIVAQSDLLAAERRPTVSAFAQAGFGAPNPLNLLDRQAAPFALIGFGAAWAITDWNRESIRRQQLELRARLVDNQAATFTFNQESQVAAYRTEVARLREQIELAGGVADLQAELLAQLEVQLDEGVITATDYLLQLNAELAARQQLSVLRAELRRVRLDFWYERGGGGDDL